MNLANTLAIFLLLAATGYIIFKILKARQNQEVEEEIELDDKTYTLEFMTRIRKKETR